ncbi:MAG: DUF927 domain-containing protein [Alphaproteobacteria bacterium]|nr:DUF927 domain-containing protein [Alphaproteobacteria bacterium]
MKNEKKQKKEIRKHRGSRRDKGAVPVVKLVANVEDESSGKAFNRFKLVKVGGAEATVELARSASEDPIKLAKELLDFNADLPTNKLDTRHLIEEALGATDKDLVLRAAQLGWHERAFVLQRAIVGQGVCRGRRLEPPSQSNEYRHPLREMGDLETWNKVIGKTAQWSSILTFGISCVFASALMKPAGMQPFIVVFTGDSKTGKTTALIVAASVIGIGSESDLPNWNMSDSAFGQAARAFNDLALIVDEIGALDGLQQDARKRIRKLIFQFAAGTSRALNSNTIYSTGAANSDARGILLTSAEKSFDVYAEIAGETRDAGEFARTIDLPATESVNSTILDRFPRNIAESGRDDWARAKLKKLRRNCQEQHGLPIAAFLEHVTSLEPVELRNRVDAAMAEFLNAVRYEKSNGVVGHMADNFALVYAGGAIAIEAGVWELSLKRLKIFLVHCFSNAVQGVPKPRDVKKETITRFLEQLARCELPSKKNAARKPSPPGFKCRQHGGEKRVELAVRTQLFRSWCGGQAGEQLVLHWLRDRNLLQASQEALGQKQLTASAVGHRKRVGKERTKWICFLDPVATNE